MDHRLSPDIGIEGLRIRSREKYRRSEILEVPLLYTRSVNLVSRKKLFWIFVFSLAFSRTKRESFE